ncbi:Dolichyl-phosphate-mannose-protein mannosyltransferase [Paenibacillus sophorae]|uniref:Dolichyl-phosphate-mannose-protein mannosyltransferase n=1 Tax=Paenibacillus sophorae TaxID=1333845 RepID=A0A1H8SCB5_9BACL|nr:glycosyltransferase family 39 protein [Paenibacillus sophorae]QWU16775.1 glycosyltransferase family 39 protein [Paenibacillus sophorae]SEO76321.1 Dolichyl-phosphate-mannose-protein mannosyltransferase [Paenibacillus sophorae]
MRLIRKLGSDLVLVAILLLAAFLYGYGIWNDKYVNLYYTTAVGSMLQSWHNFFYASLDSAGSVTVDKPPVVFWIQTLFAWIFGLKGWSVILPQALAGVGSVLLVYLLIKPAFGKMAARIGALAMALTPVAAAVSRTNNIDAMLVFTLLLATWFLFRGTKSSKIGSLIAAFALIGVAFNEKMLQAYMVVPAFYLFYWLALKMNWKKKAGVLAACTAVMLAVSVSWAVIVDSVPASERPFVGSSTTNSVMKLAFGYNGVSRLTGDRGNAGRGSFPQGMNGEMPLWNGGEGMNGAMPGMGGAVPGTNGGNSDGQDGGGQAAGNQNGNAAVGQSTNAASSGTQDGSSADDGRQNGGVGGQFPGNGADDGGRREFGQMGGNRGGIGGGAGGMFNTGTAGPLRLFQSELSGQASWLLPFILLGCVGIFSGLRRRHFTQKHKEAIFWLAWLIPVAGFFSIAGFFHQYYLIMMAPPIAALTGAGFVKLWSLYRERTDWLSWLLPAAILATAGFEWYILNPYKETIGAGWSIGILAGGIAAAGLLALFKITKKPLTRITAVAGLLVLLIGPLYWSLTPIAYGLNSMTPAAGPDSRSGMGGGMNRAFGGGSGEGGMMGMPDGNMPDAADTQSGTSVQDGANAQNGTGAQSDDGAPDSRFGGGQFGFGGSESENVNESLVAYLKEHNTGQEYLFATTNYSTGGPYIIEGSKVVILNGFSGSDVVYTTDTLQALVESGKVKYFYISGGGMGGGREGNSELTTWITEHGTEVPSSEWQGASGGTSGTLYEVTLN